ncbi:MAG: hypothetical protein ACLR23_06920 [Clostridia bacterium]
MNAIRRKKVKPGVQKEEKRREMRTRQGKMNAGNGDGEKSRRANMGKKNGKGSRVNAIRRKKVKPGVQKEEKRWEMRTRQGKMNAGNGDGEKWWRAKA